MYRATHGLRRRWDERALKRAFKHGRAALRSANPAPRLARDAAFLAACDSYRAARTDGAAGSEATSVELGGLTWWVPREDDTSAGIAGRLLQRRELPLDEILAARALARGGIMIDVGANIGTTSIPRAVLGDFECVYAAEPDADNYACFVRAVVDNDVAGLVLPERLAIGDVDGEVAFKKESSGTHHLVAGKTRASIPARVPCARLDSWLGRLGVDPDRIAFVKVDTQGWELRVLLGAPAFLARRRAVWQVEFSPQMLHRAQNDLASAYEMFRAHFTHFIDLRRPRGARGRPTTEVAEALAYVGSAEARYTNLLLYNVR